MKDHQTYGDPVGNANCLGQMISVGLVSIIFLNIKNDSNKFWNYLSIFPILGSFYLLYVLKSRGSFLFLITTISIMMILLLLKKYYSRITPNIKLFLLFSFLTFLLLLSILISQINGHDYLNIAYRENLLSAGLKIFQDNWLFGIGDSHLGKVLPNYWDKSTNLLSGAGETEYHIHNEFLNKAIEEGIISLLLFISVIILAFINGVKFYLFSNHKNSSLILPILGFFVGICMQISFDRILQFPATGLLFALLLGILLSLNESSHQKPFKISRFIIPALAVLHAVLAWPFLYQQMLYIEANSITENSKNKIEVLQNKITKAPNEVAFREIISNKLKEYPESSLKSSILKVLTENKVIDKPKMNSIFIMITDLELNWSENYESILRATQFPDFKVMTYKKYLQLLIAEDRKSEMLTVASTMNKEYPLILGTSYLLYNYYCGNKEYKKALSILQNSSQFTNDPFLEKKILLHQIIIENYFDYPKILSCVAIRKSIEYDSRYVKKNVGIRFGAFETYYIDFIYEILMRKEYDKGYALILEYLKDEKLRLKPSFKEFLYNIKTAYPDIYLKLQKENIIKI